MTELKHAIAADQVLQEHEAAEVVEAAVVAAAGVEVEVVTGVALSDDNVLIEDVVLFKNVFYRVLIKPWKRKKADEIFISSVSSINFEMHLRYKF